MTYITRATLFEKLNPLGFKTAEAATSFCKLRHHPEVEMAHWLHQLLQSQQNDIHRIIHAFDLSESRLNKDLIQYLDSLPHSHNAALDFSWVLEETIERAWVLTSLLFKEEKIRSGHLLAAMLENKRLKSQLQAISSEFQSLDWSAVHEDYVDLLAKHPEDQSAPGSPSKPTAVTDQSILEQFTIDLTEQARQGKIDSIVGRDQEIRQVINILMARRKNNPILTGEAGVGKTAVVEGLAHKIASGDVPPMLANNRIVLLDMGLLQAGASMKGQFEDRLKQIIEAVQQAETPIILFIDEAHTLMGAGGQAGTNDAANLLKPALARGTLRTIGATTFSEYKKHIEKDPALKRRFQEVQVLEPETPQAIAMLRHIIPTMEQHHGVMICDEAIHGAVNLSRRYIPAQQLPDKAVGLIDTACARVALSQHATPAHIDDIQKRINDIETELALLTKEDTLGIEHVTTLEILKTEQAEQQQRLESLQARWEQEKTVVADILKARRALLDDTLDESEQTVQRANLTEWQQQLSTLQNQQALILPEVNEDIIANVVQDWTGIPVSNMKTDAIAATLNLTETLSKRIIGQSDALDAISNRILTAKAKLENPNKPVGVFLLAGPSGVGKTETALALAEHLYGGEQNLITINMSEFQESHSVSTLKGAPPGLVGFGEGGVLTEAVKRRPYSVILLDEVEKAHSDVHEIFFQVFDKGCMDDAEGNRINFKNNLILLTTNVGSELMHHLYRQGDSGLSHEELVQKLRPELLKTFPAALLGRMIVLPYKPLQTQELERIVRLHLDKVVQRLANQSITLTYDDKAIALIVERSTDVESGGRMIDSVLTQHILPTISRNLLQNELAEITTKTIHLSAQEKDFTYQMNTA